jgi:Spy/CpxP family protein refolding chaperone
MKTLKLTLAIAALTLAPFVTSAQEKPKQSHKEQQKNRMKALNLNEKQAAQLKLIHESTKAESKVIEDKMEPLKKELKALKTEKKVLKKAKMKAIETILTPEQFIQFKEMKHKKKEHHKDNHKKH